MLVVHSTPHLEDFTKAINYYVEDKGDEAWVTLLWEHKMWSVKPGDNWINHNRKCDLAKIVMEHARNGGIVEPKAPRKEIALPNLVTPKTGVKTKRTTGRRDTDEVNVVLRNAKDNAARPNATKDSPNAQSASACVSPVLPNAKDNAPLPNAQSASACVSPVLPNAKDQASLLHNAQSASACLSPVKQPLCPTTDPGQFARLKSHFHNAR